MSDNLMCGVCPIREDNLACWKSKCGAFSITEYCGMPALCLDLKCWEGKVCNLRENLWNCPELPKWRRENPGRCEFCGAICGHHFDGCPTQGKRKA